MTAPRDARLTHRTLGDPTRHHLPRKTPRAQTAQSEFPDQRLGMGRLVHIMI